MPKQQQSLFSFFSPKHKVESRSSLGENGSNQPNTSESSLSQSIISKSKKKQKKVESQSLDRRTESNLNEKGSSCWCFPGDLVWAKLDGYPWWPGLVTIHHNKNAHAITKKNKTVVHIQFFDHPPTRAWIREKFVLAFTGLNKPDYVRGGKFYSSDPNQYKAGKEAEAVLSLRREERLGKLLLTIPSDDEEEQEEEIVEPMKFDDDIFDNEVNESKESNESKENHPEGDGPDMDQMDEETSTNVRSPFKRSRAGRPQQKRRRIRLSESCEDDSADEFKPHKDESGSSDDEGSGEDEEEDSEQSVSEIESPIKAQKTVKRKRASTSTSTPRATSKQPASRAAHKPSAVKKFRMPSVHDNDDDDDDDVVVMTEAVTPRTPVAPSSGEAGTPRLFSPGVSVATKSKLAAFSAPITAADAAAGEDGQPYTHLTLEFLKPEKIRDKYGRRPDDPEYDARTLKLPDGFVEKQTPAHKQWWLMKVDHFDTVLFFKVGKFYELFHMDAVIGTKELGLIYMKGNYAHSGFPEIAYGRYAGLLVERGFKVARVEQTETPEMMNERAKQASGKTDKVVRREVCRITTKGTKTFSFIDGNASVAENSFLLAVAEKPQCDVTGNGGQYGVCFVDTSIGKFRLGQFTDDRHCSRLRTLLAHYNPVQILYERGRLSAATSQILASTLPTVVKEALTPGKEFWDAGKTLKILSEADYFVAEQADDGIAETPIGKLTWPEALSAMLSETDSLGLTARDDCAMAISALGAVTWYLSNCLLDEELLSMRQFELYKPNDAATSPASRRTTQFMTRANMVLDGVTLANLEVVQNATTGTQEATLLDRLDTCHTPFGKRLFRQWLCAPLCNPSAIGQRLDAVDDLIGCYDLVSEVKESMKKLPDLERLLSKIHTLGSANRSKNHPDSRAIFYEDVTYSKRKIEDFLDALSGLKQSLKIMKKMQKASADFKSDLLRQTVGLPGRGRFPDITQDLEFFDNAFNHSEARKEGKIIPSRGVDKEYDDSINLVKSCEEEFNEYLADQKTKLGFRNIVYWGTGRNRYQLEIPETLAKKLPHSYTLKSSKKGYKRYWTADIEGMLSNLTNAEDKKEAALKDVMRRIFHSFDKRYELWERCVQCMSVLDVLVAMADYSRCGDGDMSRPQIICPSQNGGDGGGDCVASCNESPFIEIRGGRHPCITRTYGGGDFIPNDIVIGIEDTEKAVGDGRHDDGCVALVTGPNMGGKSTLMRQAGLIVILAQMGCYVPCTACRLTPIDRIFTRLGASDRIMAGESTFYVELSETSAILQHATQHSLILMDELGRGTATYDGTAIASAVVREISENIRCRTLFSTHYHSLVEDFSHDQNVRLGHMACMVESENDEDPTQETITFLYKFIPGACPKSYGFNAARLAELPDEVVRKGHKKAREFEIALEKLKLIRAMQSLRADNVLSVIERAKTIIAMR